MRRTYVLVGSSGGCIPISTLHTPNSKLFDVEQQGYDFNRRQAKKPSLLIVMALFNPVKNILGLIHNHAEPDLFKVYKYLK